MKKILVGLTVPTIIKIVGFERDHNIAIGRLKQHKIVFSEVLIDEYEKSFAEQGLIDNFRNWISYYEHFGDFFEYEDSKTNDFNKEIISLLEAYEHSILIKDNEKFSSDCFSVLELKDVNDNNSINELSMQCIPVTFILPKAYSKEIFCRWLKDLLADEKTIKVVDRYIMSCGGSKILETIYMPTFPKDSIVHVYFGEKEKMQTEITAIKKSFGDRIKLHNSESSDFHERYIIGDSIIITIGVGLNVFDCEHCDSRKDTNVSATVQTNIPTLPRPARPYR